MLIFKLSNLNQNLALTLGYLNPALNNSALHVSTEATNPEKAKAFLKAAGVTLGSLLCIYFKRMHDVYRLISTGL